MPRQGQSRPVTLSQPSETWRGIAGYEGRYWVSNLGRVQAIRSGKILKRRAHRDGYTKVNLKKGRSSRTFFAHALVAEAFLGPRPAGYVIGHRDGNPAHDSAKNLRYLPPDKARRHRRRLGRTTTTGVPNVYHHAKGGFYARVNDRGANIRLGRFGDLDSAAKAVRKFKLALAKHKRDQIAAPRRSLATGKHQARKGRLVSLMAWSKKPGKNQRVRRGKARQLQKSLDRHNGGMRNSLLLQKLKPK